jgi:transcriptional regulator with XRE-family HTH domain
MLFIEREAGMLPGIRDVEELAAGKEGSRSLHQAIRSAYQGRIRQDDLADALGVDQATISRWSAGKSRPNVVQMRGIETLAGRPLGWIDAQCGLIDDVCTVPQAIAMDPALSDSDRAVLLDAYYGVVHPPEHLRSAPDDAVNGGER